MPKKNPLGVPGLREKPPGTGRYVLTLYDARRRPPRKELPLKARTLTQARREAEEVRYQYFTRREIDPWTQAASIEINRAVDRYLSENAHLAPVTLTNKKSQLQAFARSVRRTHLADVTEADLRPFIEDPALAESSRHFRISTLSPLFAWAMEEGLAPVNVAASYRKVRTRRRSAAQRVAARPPAKDAMLPAEFSRLEHAVRTKGRDSAAREWDALAIGLAQATGLRRAELVGLCRRDVRLRDDGLAGTLQVRAWTNPRTGESFATKTRKDRKIPLTPRAALTARTLLAMGESVPGADDPYAPVVWSPPARGNASWRRASALRLGETFRLARESARLPAGLTLHSTRHSFLTYLVLLDLSPYLVKEIAGHESLQTQERYIHARSGLLLGGGRRLIAEVLGWLCPGVGAERVEGEVDAAYDAAGHGYGGPRLRTVLFDAALYEPVYH